MARARAPHPCREGAPARRRTRRVPGRRPPSAANRAGQRRDAEALARVRKPAHGRALRVEPEHKAAGRQGAARHPAGDSGKAGAVIDNPFLDFQLTFGDWVALGDWFEDVDEIREMLRPDGKGADRIGQLYYALFARIRPTTPKEALDAREAGRQGGWAVDRGGRQGGRHQYEVPQDPQHQALLPTRSSATPALSTADKAKRTKGGKPFGAIAQYHHDHLEAIGIAITAAHTPDESLLGEALARDGFACHFLTDAFSGSHARTPRASIEEWWDKKVPGLRPAARELARRRGDADGHQPPAHGDPQEGPRRGVPGARGGPRAGQGARRGAQAGPPRGPACR